MNKTEINLIHFGDHCAPGIIINDILKVNKKQLFILVIYEFNYIIKYLQDDTLDKIYDKKYLKKEYNKTKHLSYNFIFNHDYNYDEYSNIINYDFKKSRFIEKIKNYNEIFKLNMFNIFINFTQNVNNLNIDGFLQLYKNKINFHLIIFTNNDYNSINHENISIVKLKNNYEAWYSMNKNTKNILYEEIYMRFIEVLNKNKIIHNFPSLI